MPPPLVYLTLLQSQCNTEVDVEALMCFLVFHGIEPSMERVEQSNVPVN